MASVWEENALEVTSNVLEDACSEDIPGDLFSDRTLQIFQWVIFTAVCQIIDIFGIGSNIINIICFIKQGFKDTINISLLGLAISDIGCLAPLVWTNICFTPALSQNVPFDPFEMHYMTSGMFHLTFTRITAWITAMITVERCLCVTMPLKVKTVVSPKRTFAILVCIYVILISSVVPLYFVNSLGFKWFADRNQTLLGIVSMERIEHFDTIFYAINNVFVPFSAFLVIVICTITLAIHLKVKTTWRKRFTTVNKDDHVLNRNHKVVKMVVMISILFISCFFPISIACLVMSFEPELSVEGKYRNALMMIGGMGIVLESINSSMNIFIYYNISSKYRATFRQVCCICNG